jgi:uncharacterized phage infection (PIP) family protein YhgE
MDLRELLSRLVNWLRNRLPASHSDYEPPQLDDDGLIMEQTPSGSAGRTPTSSTTLEAGDQTSLKTVAVRGRTESLEKLQVGFDRLIGELNSINDHLAKQVAQHNDLISRVDHLPNLVESFPAIVENQKLLTEQLVSQLKANILKDQQLLSAVEKIPMESAKQTDALVNIDRQLAAAADVDIQMTDTFNKFNQSLEKINHSTKEHTDGIAQMSRTFAASDRYLKFIVSRQNRQFMWVFYSALVVCAVVILILVGVIIYVAK